MKGNKTSILAIIAIIIGLAGFGIGITSLIIGGPQGEPGIDGQDGLDGLDAPGNITVGILGLNEGENVSGVVTIRAIVMGSDNYTLRVIKNNWTTSYNVPFSWDTTKEANGWWNITVKATDLDSGEDNQDAIMVYVKNPAETYTYYCSSREDFDLALTEIGTGYGKIIITENIDLSSSIEIDGGGSYIIEGAGFVTIRRTADQLAFWILNASSVIMRDLVINATPSTNVAPMRVEEVNNNLVYFENLQIYGDYNGRGIDLRSDNITIQNCEFTNLYSGVYIIDQKNIRILGNNFYFMAYCGIQVLTGIEDSIISNNIMDHVRDGVASTGIYRSIVSNNLVTNIARYGFYVDGNFSTYTGNM